MPFTEKAGLSIDSALYDFLVDETLPGTGVDAERYFADFSAIVHDLAPENRALLKTRDALQGKLDAWYRENGAPSDMAAYEAFLREIGYLLPEGGAFKVTTENVDPEIASLAGLAPHPRDSGQSNGRRRTTPGRAGLRPVLFMAALSAARRHPQLAGVYSRLLNAGKPKRLALTAVARKLLVIANAKLRDQRIQRSILT